MGVTTTQTNKPLNPRGNDQSPLAYNRAKLFSGKALDFDGVNDYVDCGTLDVTAYTAISVAGYINKDATSTQVAIGIKHTGSDDIRFVVSANIELGVDDGTYHYVTTPINNNEWYFAVLTFDGSTLKGYLNGVEFGSKSASFDFSTADGKVTIGQRDGGSLPYNGRFANARVFNTALTAAQVADLYNNPEKVVPTGVDNTALKLWLPMQEGAGTTAYDGSGNGNHGTISGATYVNGIGAPVAQTAVIDWNKYPLLDTVQSLEVDTSSILNGSTFAMEFTFVMEDISSEGVIFAIGNTGGTYIRYTAGGDTISIYLDATTNYSESISNVTRGKTNTLKITNTGTRIQVDLNGTNVRDDLHTLGTLDTLPNEFGQYASSIGTADLLLIEAKFWSDAGTTLAAHLKGPTYEDLVGSNDGTLDGSSTKVLLPQGLTTGRDITGVNLFENVRKQGALNLDGNSWAEVHDNESLDFGTGSFSLEAWAKAKYTSGGSIYNVIMILGGNASTAPNAAILVDNSVRPQAMYNNQASVTPSQTTGDWYHIVAAYDETDMFVFINGAQVLQNGRTAVNITNDLVKYIGRDNSSQRYYSDQIAQPRIYNRALTAEEVARNYNNAKSIYTNS